MHAVEELESLLSDQPATPLRPHPVENYKEEKVRLDAIVNAPPFVDGDRSVAFNRSRKITDLLDKQAPRTITDPARLNRVNRLTTEILETVIKPAMLSRAVMRRNPPGAVDAFMRRENSKIVKRAKIAWKRARWALDPTNDNKDFTNLEIARPEGTPGQTSSFMAEAQIPGFVAMSEQAKANWPLGEPKATTAISHLKTGDVAVDQVVEDMQEAAGPLQHETNPTIPAPPENALQLPCECGCGKMIDLGKTGKKRYVNKSHRVRASLLRRKRAMEENPINLAPRAPAAVQAAEE